MIPCAPEDFKRQYHCYLKTIGSEIKNEDSLELEKAILDFWLKTLRDSKVRDLKGSRLKYQSRLAASFSGIVKWH